MEKHSCSGHVSNDRMGVFSCAKPGKKKWQDKWWCHHHDPREKEKKREALKEKWAREQREDDKKKDKADKLLKRLGVQGDVEYMWRGGYQSAIVIGFDEVEKLLKELGR